MICGFTPTTTLRFVSWLLWGYFGGSSAALFNTIRTHEVLKREPYPKNLIAGQGIAGVVGIFGIAWCFISFGLDGYFWASSFGESGSSPALTATSFALDLAFTICLFTALVLQSTYLPHTLAGCSAATKWRVTGNETSLFAQIAVINNSTSASENLTLQASDVCKNFVTLWIMCFVMMLLSLLGVVIAFSTGATNPVRGRMHALLKYHPIRFALRYSSRRRQKVHRTPKLRLRNLRGKTQNQTTDIGLASLLHWDVESDISTGSYNTNRSQQASLLHFKHRRYDVLQQIAFNLHYVDIINLSLVSRRIHKVIFSYSRLRKQSELLRLSTCHKNSKSHCWACNIQICNSCKVSRICSDTEASTHLQRCRAYCSICHYKLLRRNRSKKYQGKSASCKCNATVENNSSISIWDDSTRRYARAVNQQTPARAEHAVCRSCNALSEESMLCVREKGDEDEMKQLVRGTLTCANCRISLSTSSPRWWICSKCCLECRSPVHPPWATTAAT